MPQSEAAMSRMTPKFKFHECLVVLCLLSFGECHYYVTISDDGPIVQGGTITFQAEVYDSDGSRPEGTFRFTWKDDTLPLHSWVDETRYPNSTWSVTYPREFYPGPYEVQVNVDKYDIIFYHEICSRRQIFNISAFLNGKMELVQGSLINSNFVSNETQVEHEIDLSRADHAFLKNATEVSTYWFVDCVFYGLSEDLTFNYSYSAVGADHLVEALVVASFEPIITTTTPPTTTTSTTPSTTTTSTTTSSTASPPNSTILSSSASPSLLTALKDAGNTGLNTNEVGSTVNQGLTFTNVSHIKVPYVCRNSSIVPPDKNKTYGYFHRKMSVRAPIQNITIKGTNWLQEFETLDLQVVCRGSGNFNACNLKKPADYNSTGEETCPPNQISVSPNCQFNVSQFYSSSNYTVLFIISNDVSKIVYPIKVILYKVQKHAQLSVIVVPVVCSLIAVIMVVFGVAYYVQRRKRFTVEVADFDFGHGVGDMEYKTFRERLREAVLNSVNRDFGVDGEGNVWSPSRKYGSMQ